MSNVTNGGKVHIMNRTTHGVYPLCNPGLLIGSVLGSSREFFHGKWKRTDAETDCSKCVNLKRKGQ